MPRTLHKLANELFLLATRVWMPRVEPRVRQKDIGTHAYMVMTEWCGRLVGSRRIEAGSLAIAICHDSDAQPYKLLSCIRTGPPRDEHALFPERFVRRQLALARADGNERSDRHHHVWESERPVMPMGVEGRVSVRPGSPCLSPSL